MITVTGPWWQLMLSMAAGIFLGELLAGFIKGLWKGFRGSRHS